MCQCKHNACKYLEVSIPGSRLQELALSKLEIGTYTTNSQVGWILCVLFGNPDTKHLQKVTFCVVSNNGSVLLSCVTALALGLIQPHTGLDYLPPRASLITKVVLITQRRQSLKLLYMYPEKNLQILQCLTAKV